MTLEIASATRQDWLASEQPDFTVGEIDNSLFTLFQIHAPVYVNYFRHGILYRVTFCLLVMPNYAMLIRWKSGKYFLHLFNARRKTVTLHAACRLQRHGRIVHKLELSMLIAYHGSLHAHFMIVDMEFRQDITFVRISEIRRLL